jgi:hypothetical protein
MNVIHIGPLPINIAEQLLGYDTAVLLFSAGVAAHILTQLYSHEVLANRNKLGTIICVLAWFT